MSQKIGQFDKEVSQRRRFSEGNWKSVPTYNVCQLTTVYPTTTDVFLFRTVLIYDVLIIGVDLSSILFKLRLI